MAEGRGFEPPVGLLLRLISSQVPLTTQPPFRSNHCPLICANQSRQQAELREYEGPRVRMLSLPLRNFKLLGRKVQVQLIAARNQTAAGKLKTFS
jgi:hypothetical protein